MHVHYTRIDEAWRVMKASEPSSSAGIPVLLVPPPNAKYCAPEDVGVSRTYYLHFTNGFFEHSDWKMHSILYRAANGSASSHRTGGLRVNVAKNSILCEPAFFLLIFGCVFERRSVSSAFSLG